IHHRPHPGCTPGAVVRKGQRPRWQSVRPEKKMRVDRIRRSSQSLGFKTCQRSERDHLSHNALIVQSAAAHAAAILDQVTRLHSHIQGTHPCCKLQTSYPPGFTDRATLTKSRWL